MGKPIVILIDLHLGGNYYENEFSRKRKVVIFFNAQKH